MKRAPPRGATFPHAERLATAPSRAQIGLAGGVGVGFCPILIVPVLPRFPLRVREGSVVVTIYRNRARSTVSGWTYVISWIGAEGREREQRSVLEVAREFAAAKARFLCQGIADGAMASRADFIELAEVRRLAEEGNATTIGAMTEWLQARAAAGAHVIEACREWSARGAAEALVRITVPDAVDKFIAEKVRAKKQGERVYRSKLNYAVDHFGPVLLDSISEAQWAKFLETFDDAVSRNDVRKRCVTLCRWARRRKHLPKLLLPTIEETERAKESPPPIGIIKPERLRRLLELFLREDLQRHLGALVLANFAGLRVEEIHGKRGDPERRQSWDDIHLDRAFLSVTAAKENTPSSRIVHLSAAAMGWLKLCPDAAGNFYPQQSGPVCEVNAVTRIRDIARTHEMMLPKNAFRHSWISYRIALTGDKASTATEAGNSVKEIDKRYRVPLPKFLGEEWFAIIPTSDGASTHRPPEGHSE